jgi:hypothetical protein
MGVTPSSPSDIFIGAPAQVLWGGRELGATTGTVTVRIRPENIFTPQVNGIPGLLAMTDYLTAEVVEAEFTLLEMSKANLLAVLAGSTENPADVIKRVSTRRYPSSMSRDLMIVLKGLDPALLTINMPQTTCTSGLEFSGADDAAVSPTLTFSGRYKLGSDFWSVVRKAVVGIEFMAGIPATGRSDPNGTVVTQYVRAVSILGRPITYTFAGLPTGLTGNTATGDITGTIASTLGAKAVTVTANDGVSVAKVLNFTWTVT